MLATTNCQALAKVMRYALLNACHQFRLHLKQEPCGQKSCLNNKKSEWSLCLENYLFIMKRFELIAHKVLGLIRDIFDIKKKTSIKFLWLCNKTSLIKLLIAQLKISSKYNKNADFRNNSNATFLVRSSCCDTLTRMFELVTVLWQCGTVASISIEFV
ncbi:hypothetical protein BpHYR1_022100 [Brachionus plicatilis]|uniref:Uncharacterized protein n=1 Tax=Brachionus plicatilis TaxID=10195 RepID=A0A3M7SV25_BRAPC|nr:hypothetical protein BpHYR1_022100 [Brachionus plicatilis]